MGSKKMVTIKGYPHKAKVRTLCNKWTGIFPW
jgi:hypothetical protein